MIRNLFIFLAIIVVTTAKTYDGYKVYKVFINSEKDLEVVRDVQSRHVGEVWEVEFVVNQAVKIMVAPEKQTQFLEDMKAQAVETTEVIADLQRAIEEQMSPAKIRQRDTFHSLSWDQYYSLDKVYAWLDELAEAYPDIVTAVTMGKSVENRDIKGIIINYKQNTTLIGMLEGTLHAREWITTTTVTYITKEFLTSTDPAVRELAENFEWHIFPVVNPDGYDYTFTTNRFWRKNRSVASFKPCPGDDNDDMSNGVDLNRNFDYQWMVVGASDDACSNTYAGPSAASEPETKAISDYVSKLNDQGRLMYYISFHSYTQLIIVPYSHLPSGNDVGRPNNYGDMFEIARRGREAIFESSGKNYTVGVSADVLYPMSGASFDWVKNKTDVPICYLVELRDLGEYGFLLNTEQIIPTASEIMAGMIEMDKTAREIGYYEIEAHSAATKAVFTFALIFSVAFFTF